MNRLFSPVINLDTFTGVSLNQSTTEAIKSLGFDIDQIKKLYNKKNTRINEVFYGNRNGKIPINADLRWWFNEKYHDGTLKQNIQNIDIEKILESSFTADIKEKTFYDPLPDIIEEEYWSGPPIEYKKGGYPGTKRTVVIKTPKGNLTSTESYASRSFGVSEYAVKEIGDLKIITYIYEQRAKHISYNEYVPLISLTPIQNLIVHMAGIIQTSYLINEYPDEIHSFLCYLDDLLEPFIEENATKGNIFSVENLSSDLSASYFDEYLGPQLKRRSEIAKKNGYLYGIHQDGMLKPLLGKLQSVGVGYANGITCTPSGDINPEDIRTIAGNSIILIDLVPQCIFMDDFSENYFNNYIENIVNIFKNDKKIIFGIGDMLPSTGSLKRFEKMINIIDDKEES